MEFSICCGGWGFGNRQTDICDSRVAFELKICDFQEWEDTFLNLTFKVFRSCLLLENKLIVCSWITCLESCQYQPHHSHLKMKTNLAHAKVQRPRTLISSKKVIHTYLLVMWGWETIGLSICMWRRWLWSSWSSSR